MWLPFNDDFLGVMEEMQPQRSDENFRVATQVDDMWSKSLKVFEKIFMRNWNKVRILKFKKMFYIIILLNFFASYFFRIFQIYFKKIILYCCCKKAKKFVREQNLSLRLVIKMHLKIFILFLINFTELLK